MPDDRRSWVVPDGPVTPEEVAHRGFATSFRGFDPNEVRNYLTRVSETLRTGRDRLRELERQLREAESRAAHPILDEATLTSALGEHTSRILASAHDAATEIRTRSQESIERVLREAHETSARIRGDAERLLADRTAEAEAEAERIVELARANAARIQAGADEEASSLVGRAKEEGRSLVGEAQAMRARVLGDLARRRRVAHVQVEQLRAGRDRLLEAYRVVQQTLEEVTEELQRAEVEARAAAQSAAQRVAAEPETGADELEAALAASTEIARAAEVTEPATAPAAEAEVASPVAAGEPEPAEPEPAGPAPAQPEPAAVAGGPRSDRPLSALRILRRARGPLPDEPVPEPPAELKVIQPPADIEAVRVIREPVSPPPEDTPPPPAPPAEAAEVVAEPEAAPEPEPEQEPEPERAPVATAPPVDDLFARIRAEADAAPPEPPPDAPAEAPAADAQAKGEAEHEPEPEPAPPSEDERRLEQRDGALEPLEQQLSRRLKRLLQDEQNEVLDRLRVHRGKPSLDVAFPDAPNGHDLYHRACADLLEQARRTGAAYAGSDDVADDEDVGVGDLAERLAEEIRGPLRRRLAQGLDEAASLDEDDFAVAERVGAAYRDWKFQRIEGVVADHLGAAFARGAFLAWPRGTPLRWVVDQAEGRCPDCDDNALAGTLPRGAAYPTGQLHPPAHGGCRCLLVPSA